MTDLKSNSPLFLREEELYHAMELLFFAYRSFTEDPDKILATFHFGRAHHRAIHFVGRNPGIPVFRLLSVLKITKQSLSRVLGQLIEEGFIEQKKGRDDARQRLLYLTPKGSALARQLSAPQAARLAQAFRHAGPSAVAGFREVLMGMLDAEDAALITEIQQHREKLADIKPK
jgi:DNA-binding MarR family transcriptional regulator